MIAFWFLPELGTSGDSSKIWVIFKANFDMKNGVVYRKSLKIGKTFHGVWPRSLSIIKHTREGVIMAGTYSDDA